VRDEVNVNEAMKKTADKFGGIDIVVNNASAIQLLPTTQLDMKRFDLMHQVNARGTYLTSKCALPHLKASAAAGRNPHILALSPPLDMNVKWFASSTGYSMAKFGMSLVVLGLSGELKGQIGVNALWPRTTIATSAIRNLLGGDNLMAMSRSPEILADAAHAIFTKPSSFTGNFLIDDTFLAGEGVTDFDRYRIDPTKPLAPDFFVPDGIAPPAGATYGPLTA
jgi:citronellol/citronellal dehydrogenase